MGFTEYLRVPALAERYRKVKRYFFIRESAYDVTSACQLRCEGCYYFEGEKYKVKDNRDAAAWRRFMAEEKARGINYVNLAGAEPALAPKILAACYEVIPLGNIFSNGLRKIDPALRYRLHLSVWGDSTGDPKYRKYFGGKPGPYCLPIQLDNYRGDDRVIFVYTFNSENVDQVDEVLERVAGEGHQLTFNVFSAPVESGSQLRQLEDTLRRTREKMLAAMEDYGETVVYSRYNARVHTQGRSLHAQFGCPYPRAQLAAGREGVGIGKSFRSYRTDLSHVPASDCCIPDTDCADCRHYAAGSAIVSSRLSLHVESESQFRGWLDYVDTYLAIWILGYRRGEDLYTDEEAAWEPAARSA
jgi:hypothetical protein